MAVVVDASAIGAIIFGEPEAETLRAHLAGETLPAPTLIDVELVTLDGPLAAAAAARGLLDRSTGDHSTRRA